MGMPESLPSLILSYARADDEDGLVAPVHRRLCEEGFSVWWPRPRTLARFEVRRQPS